MPLKETNRIDFNMPLDAINTSKTSFYYLVNCLKTPIETNVGILEYICKQYPKEKLYAYSVNENSKTRLTEDAQNSSTWEAKARRSAGTLRPAQVV